jgi:hypothetical protein
VVDGILVKSKKGLSLPDLASKVTESGYKSNSRNFKNVVYRCVYNSENIVHDAATGCYRIERLPGNANRLRVLFLQRMLGRTLENHQRSPARGFKPDSFRCFPCQSYGQGVVDVKKSACNRIRRKSLPAFVSSREPPP